MQRWLLPVFLLLSCVTFSDFVSLGQLAAAQDNIMGQFLLGLCAWHGIGMTRDPKDAVRLLRLAAADPTMVKAQEALAVCLRLANHNGYICVLIAL